FGFEWDVPERRGLYRRPSAALPAARSDDGWTVSRLFRPVRDRERRFFVVRAGQLEGLAKFHVQLWSAVGCAALPGSDDSTVRDCLWRRFIESGIPVGRQAA